MELVRRPRIRSERLVRVGLTDEDQGSMLTTLLSVLAIVVILGLFTASTASTEEGPDHAGT